MPHVSFETTVKGGLPCTVEATINIYREGGELFTETASLEVFWPTTKAGRSRPMPLNIWKMDAATIEAEAEERAFNA